MSSPISGKVIQGYFPHGPKLPAAPPPAPLPHRVSAPPTIQRHANAFALPPNVLNVGNSVGQPLPPPLLREMESLFNTSFGNVRIHAGREAQAIGAHAFTEGANIHFAPGRYNPATPAGKRLLGHELTHVIQQRHGHARNPFGSGIAVLNDRMMEAEADRMGARAAAPVRAAVPSPIAAPIQRKPAPRFIAPAPQFRPVVQRSNSSENPFEDTYKKIIDTGTYYKGLALDKIDKTFQTTGKHLTGMSRDLVKLKHKEDEWFFTKWKKSAYNTGVDVVFDNVNFIWDVTKGYGSGVIDQIVPKTKDRLDPGHILTLARNPDLTKRYLNQRKEQLLQIVDLYNNPVDFGNKKYNQYKNTFYNYSDTLFGLDTGRRLAHGGSMVVDLSQQMIATALGVSIAMFTLFNTFPGARKNTKDTMDWMFPKEKLYGKGARYFPVKLLFTKPLSKIVGNPYLAMAALLYSGFTGMGMSIRDSIELREKDPEKHKRLVENKTDTYRSGFWLDMFESLNRWSKKK